MSKREPPEFPAEAGFAALAAWVALALGLVPVAAWASPAALTTALREIEAQSGIPLYWLGATIRLCLVGSSVSEPLGDLLHIVGREESLRRLTDVALRRVA